MNIRRVDLSDSAQIADIYNYYIKNTHHTFETEPLDVAQTLERITQISDNYPYLVAEDEGEILGYAFATQFKLRQAYQYSAEVSIYVRHDAKQRKVGTQLYVTLFEQLAETDIHAIIAGISLPNDPSVIFHERLGFEKVAHFKEVGYKLGRWIDVGYWELMNV